MPVILRKLEQIDEFLKKAETGFSCILLVLMVFVVGLGVFLRYILKNPLIAGANMATLMLVWLSFFGASVVYKDKGHIAIEFIVDHFPKGFRKKVIVFIYLIIAVALSVTVVQAVRLMNVQWHQQIVALEIPRSVLSLPVVITGSFMLLTTIRHMLTEIDTFPKNKKEV